MAKKTIWTAVDPYTTVRRSVVRFEDGKPIVKTPYADPSEAVGIDLKKEIVDDRDDWADSDTEEALTSGALATIASFGVKYGIEKYSPKYGRYISYPLIAGLGAYLSVKSRDSFPSQSNGIAVGTITGIIIHEFLRYYTDKANAMKVVMPSATRVSGSSVTGGGRVIAAPAELMRRSPETPVVATSGLQPRVYNITSEGINNGAKMMTREEFIAEVQKNKMSSYPVLATVQGDQAGAGLAASLEVELERLGIQVETSQ